MGLDIYLHKYEDFDDAVRREKEYEAGSAENWGTGTIKYDDMSPHEKDEASKKDKALAEKLGLDEYGSGAGDSIEINSKLHPKHMFKIGYLRSSYNNGGINHILGNTVGRDLHWIFDAPKESQFKPDWVEALRRANRLLSDFKKFIEENGAYMVLEISQNQFGREISEIDTENKAMETFIQQKKKHVPDKFFGSSFSNKDGHFFLGKGLKVTAIIEGSRRKYFANEKIPCVYVIHEEEKKFKWYVEALEVVVEMCEWVLNQAEIEQYVIHWSS